MNRWFQCQKGNDRPGKWSLDHVSGLKLEDLSSYNVPLVEFNGKTIVPKGMIRLPVQTGKEVVNVDFIVVEAYSPYTAILVRPCLHAMGAIP